MKERKDPCLNGLSEPELDKIRENLQALDQLTAQSHDIAIEIQRIVQKLKTPIQEQGSVFSTIKKNFRYLRDVIGNDIGLVLSKYTVSDGQTQVGVAYIESLTDKQLVSSQVIEPLLVGNKVSLLTGSDTMCTLIRRELVSVAGTRCINLIGQIIEGLLNGDTALFAEGENTALLIASRQLKQRAIEKPLNEGTVLASLDSFTEDLATNRSMIIKRLPLPALRSETFTKGTLSRTKLNLIWLEGIANPTVIEEARNRINSINIDNIDGIGTVAELIEDRPLSLFPKYRQTERPDLAAKALTEGRFAVLCDTSPFAFVAPISLWDNLKTMDDYGERSTSASYLRIVRYLAFLLSILISPIYLSFVTYNHTIVPQSLAVALATGRAGVPFPSVVELLLMTFAITVIRESAMRIPGSVGYFVGTLAAVVIGQASVAAGFISASIIIVVATSEISAFAISTTTMVYTSRLINYFFILLAGLFGMFGLINGITIIFWHLASLESFGVPYLYPLVPFELSAMRDTFVRFGILKKRFRILAPFNRIRTGK